MSCYGVVISIVEHYYGFFNMITALRRWKLCRLKSLFLVLCALACPLVVWRLSGASSPQPAPYIETYAGSRNLSDYLYPGQESLMEPYAHSCSRETEHQVVVLVASAPSYARRRHLARETWAKLVPTFFFLGRSSEQELRMNDELVNSYVESKRHNDVIVGDYLDSYENLTIKTAHMLGWAVQNCPGAKYYLKMDDDALLNPWRLRMMLEKVDPNRGELVGYRYDGARPDRDVSSKTYLPGWLFTNEEFPPYLSGAGYLIDAKHTSSIYETAFKIPFLHIEDLFITGIVAGQTLGLELTHSSRFSYTYFFSESGCLHWNMVIVHRLTPSRMLRIWNKVRQLGLNHDRGGKNFFCRMYEYVFFHSVD